MAARPQYAAIKLEHVSANPAGLKGLFYSSERNEIFTAANHCVLSFQAEHGKNGIYHEIAGTPRSTLRPQKDALVDGMSSKASFMFGEAVSFCESSNGSLLVTDPGSHAVRCIDTSLKHVTTLTGIKHANANGRAGEDPSIIHRPGGITFDIEGRLVIVDTGAHRILRLLEAEDQLETIGGQFVTPGFKDGPASVSLFNKPFGVVDIVGYGLVIADSANRRIRVLRKSGNTDTVAGSGIIGTSDGPAHLATFSSPQSICANAYGDILVTDPPTSRIRLIQANGFVSTLLRPQLLYGRVPTSISGIAISCDGDILLSDRIGLFKVHMNDSFKTMWDHRHNSLSRLKFGHILEIESEEVRNRMCPVIIKLPSIEKSIQFPKAFLAMRCPSLLDSSIVSLFQSLNVSETSVNLFIEYLFDDSLKSLSKDLAPSIVHLAAIAQLTQKEALAEHCLWLTFAFALEGGSAKLLVETLKAAIDVNLHSATTDLMKAIVSHNHLFSNLDHIALLKAALPPERNIELKSMLKRNDVLPVVRLRQRSSDRLFGSMASQYAELLLSSLDGNPIEPDLALVCSRDGSRHLIRCHSFVLYARWLYVRPLLKYSFSESQKGELELMKPDGILFDFEWVQHFLAFIYHGGLSGLEDPSFIQTTSELSDYLLLSPEPELSPSQSSPAHHPWFVSRLKLAHPTTNLTSEV